MIQFAFIRLPTWKHERAFNKHVLRAKGMSFFGSSNSEYMTLRFDEYSCVVLRSNDTNIGRFKTFKQHHVDELELLPDEAVAEYFKQFIG